MTTSMEDRNYFFSVLAIYDRPESELRQKCLPASTDIDSWLETVFGDEGFLSPP